MTEQITAMDDGAYNARMTYSSSGSPAAWPPDEASEVSYGPDTTLHSAAAAFSATGSWDLPWGFRDASDPAPDEFMSPVMFSRSVVAWTFDVSEVDTDAMDGCVLTLAMQDGDPQGIGFIFGSESVSGDLGSSGPNWSNTTQVAIAWIGGSFDDLSNHEAIFTDRAATWPWENPEVGEAYVAGSIDMLDFVTPIVGANSTVGTVQVPLANWEYWLREHDWVSLVFTTAVVPSHFWMWGDFEQFEPDATPYVGRNWIPFDPQAFLFSGHPLADVSIEGVPLAEETEDIELAAISAMGSLRARGRLLDPPRRPPPRRFARPLRDRI